jgi:DNA-binding transcriptional LysR family regulator
MMDKLSGMATFVSVVELGSFAAAAAAADVSATMVAKQVRAIEDRLGARLLHRTTRRQQLTEVGRLYLERCRSALAAVALAEGSALELQSTPRGQLRIVAPVGFGSRILAPALVDYMAAHPEVDVALTLNDRPEEMVSRGHELGIAIGDLRDGGLVARALEPYRRILAAAPAYLAVRGHPKHPRDLAGHDCLGIMYWRRNDRWQLQGPGGEVCDIAVRGRFTSNQGSALRRAAVRGAGIVLQPEHALAEDIRAMRLVPVLKAWTYASTPMYLIHAQDRKPTAKLRSAIDFLVARFATQAPGRGDRN